LVSIQFDEDFCFGDKLLRWVRSSLHEKDDADFDGRLLGWSWATRGKETWAKGWGKRKIRGPLGCVHEERSRGVAWPGFEKELGFDPEDLEE
jgi:hypothetical protein